MFLDNYADWFRLKNLYPTTSVTANNSNVKNLSGNAMAICYAGNTTVITTNGICFHGTAVIFGSGKTEPTLSDYCLDNCITDYENLQTAKQISYDNGHVKIIYTVSGTYTGEEDTQISEVGILKTLYTTSASATDTTLFTRDLLSSPIPLTTGQAFSFVINIDWSNN